ncbi:hypothetical protein FA13DRAFT_1765059 [Coprinellus micaceus]|uniref:Uncharacterized protein n=1 Tax=Coprinellus micaceus TaxID=71717 RepID=A0A4Y7T513_COPMI|nr:hypothetical protein FA13DRAFT_1765059 [Coprinellus micaceus]
MTLIFLLYTELQAAPPHDPANPRGLGFVNSKQDVLELRFDLTAPPGSDSQKPARKRGKKGKSKPDAITSSVEVELLQNTTALPISQRRHRECGLEIEARVSFDHGRLADSHILELGAGTGLLSLVLSPFVRKYTVTDTEDLVALIRKNLRHNFPNWGFNTAPGSAGANVSVETLDWVELQQRTESQKNKLLSSVVQPVDLVLAFTSVLVLSELRSEEVMREFLQSWLVLPGWKIWHVGGDLLREPHYVMWVGQKE